MEVLKLKNAQGFIEAASVTVVVDIDIVKQLVDTSGNINKGEKND